MKVIIAAAGTGGHINPAIAIANKIKQKNQNSEIVFIGTVRGLENDLVPRAGYKLKSIEAYGISRKFTIKNISNIIKTLNGFKSAKRIIRDFKPDLVIGTGGYICGPVIMAAKKYNIPTILHESNAFPGAAVRLLSSKVDEVLLGFSDAKVRLPKAKKITVTGTPTKINKMNFTSEEKSTIIKKIGIKEKTTTILIFGGSQGAKTINTALIDMIEKKSVKNYQVIWATGQTQYNIVKHELMKKDISIDNVKNFKILPYIYNMEEIMNISDVIICRSGAMTITEIAKLGKPAIFIPFPFATENHQEYNARVLEKIGAAKIILDKDLNSTILLKEINNIVSNKKQLEEMGKKATTIATEDVEEKIYKEISRILEEVKK